MVTFDKLRINKDDSLLKLKVSIIDNPIYYRNVFIDKIIIDTLDTFIDTGPSSKPVYTYLATDNLKLVYLELGVLDLLSGIKGNLFFIYVVTKGVPDPSTPCGEDNTTSRAIAYNLYPFYNTAILYLKLIGLSCDSTCNIPSDFINILLQMKAIEFSIRTGHYLDTINLWNKLKLKHMIYEDTCKCNGRY